MNINKYEISLNISNILERFMNLIKIHNDSTT